MSALPELRLSDWRETKDTLHLYCQILGKIRMATTAPRCIITTSRSRSRSTSSTMLGSGSLAVLPYETVRTAPDPRALLLAFCQGAYEAGARLAGWDIAAFASGSGGVALD